MHSFRLLPRHERGLTALLKLECLNKVLSLHHWRSKSRTFNSFWKREQHSCSRCVTSQFFPGERYFSWNKGCEALRAFSKPGPLTFPGLCLCTSRALVVRISGWPSRSGGHGTESTCSISYVWPNMQSAEGNLQQVSEPSCVSLHESVHPQEVSQRTQIHAIFGKPAGLDVGDSF